MASSKNKTPRWLENLRTLMDARGFNPRSLSLRAGLNPTAIRDMLEGRIRFPRYDTVQALALALGVSSAQLMSDENIALPTAGTDQVFDEKLDLMVEIIARLQEVAGELNLQLPPRDFAAMAATIYRQMKNEPASKRPLQSLQPKIHDLLAYEALKKRAAR